MFNCLLNIVYPGMCMSCGKLLDDNAINKLICNKCWLGIKKNTPPLCAVCGRQIRRDKVSAAVCPDCSGAGHFSFDRAFGSCVYEGVARELIHRFKYQNRDYLSPLLARLLIESVYRYRLNLETFDLVIPVPLHKIRLREREFNHAELIARQVAKEFSLALSSTNLWRRHHRRAQMELKKEERWKNIKGCFALHNPAEVKAKNIILIDDVLTTGATCSEAASVLKAAGAANVWALTLAN